MVEYSGCIVWLISLGEEKCVCASGEVGEWLDGCKGDGWEYGLMVDSCVRGIGRVGTGIEGPSAPPPWEAMAEQGPVCLLTCCTRIELECIDLHANDGRW